MRKTYLKLLRVVGSCLEVHWVSFKSFIRARFVKFELNKTDTNFKKCDTASWCETLGTVDTKEKIETWVQKTRQNHTY